MVEVTITSREEGQRLDKFLKKYLSDAPAGFLYKMLRKRNITLNGKKADGSEMLSCADRIIFFFSEETFQKFRGNGMALGGEMERLASLPMKGLRIVYEDDDILAADKPCNMLSQKAKSSDVSANEYLLGYLIREKRITLEDFMSFRPSVCNRLDRNTTGLLLMGKTLKGSQELSRGLKERSIQKYYRAIVKGHIDAPAHCRGYLRKDEQTNRVEILDKMTKGAVEIETSYVPIVRKSTCTLLEIHLITGKTHQIRAHLASLGHPIIGDPKYGDRTVNQSFALQYPINHQLLHAYRMEFPDGRRIYAKPPVIFEQLLNHN